jgi:hypothetical protein
VTIADGTVRCTYASNLLTQLVVTATATATYTGNAHYLAATATRGIG